MGPDTLFFRKGASGTAVRALEKMQHMTEVLHLRTRLVSLGDEDSYDTGGRELDFF